SPTVPIGHWPAVRVEPVRRVRGRMWVQAGTACGLRRWRSVGWGWCRVLMGTGQVGEQLVQLRAGAGRRGGPRPLVYSSTSRCPLDRCSQSFSIADSRSASPTRRSRRGCPDVITARYLALSTGVVMMWEPRCACGCSQLELHARHLLGLSGELGP